MDVQIITYVLVILIILLQVLDVWVTNKVLSQGGGEQNPITRWYMKKTGKYWWTSKFLSIIPVIILGALSAGWVSAAPLMLIFSLYVLIVLNKYTQIR